MTPATPPDPTPPPLSERLERLIALGPTDHPRSDADIAATASSTGAPVPVELVTDLRTANHQKRPTDEQLRALAIAFDISPDYLLGDPTTVDNIDSQLELLLALRDSGLSELPPARMCRSPVDPHSPAGRRIIADLVRQLDNLNQNTHTDTPGDTGRTPGETDPSATDSTPPAVPSTPPGQRRLRDRLRGRLTAYRRR